MKLKTVAIAAAALALAVGMTACGGSASTAASSTASSAAASSEAASSEAASSEAEATSAEYTVYNTTGSKVTELYLYDAGSEDKGENLAGEGLADGESIVITRDVEADKQADVVYVLEFTTEDGNTQSFDTLHYEVAPISLKSVDALQDARRAVQLDPNNTEYQMHLRRMQNPGQTYRTQTTYAQPGGLLRWCWSMILLNLLCNCCCGGWGFRGFRM